MVLNSWQRVKHVYSTLLLNKFNQLSKSLLELRNLLSGCPELRIIVFNLLLVSLLLLLEYHDVFLHDFLGWGQLMIHLLKLIEVFLTSYQFVQCSLEAVSLIFCADVLQLWDKLVSFSKLFPLVFDLSGILLVLFHDHGFLLFHLAILLQNNLGNSCFDPLFHLLYFSNLALLCLI